VIDDFLPRVETACAELTEHGEPVTFDAVAKRARMGRATLYRRPELRAIVEDARARGREAHTLSGLTAELQHLRVALEAIADKVRHHEELLRRLNHDRQS
jgi:AcrR family transcriptional regulator